MTHPINIRMGKTGQLTLLGHQLVEDKKIYYAGSPANQPLEYKKGSGPWLIGCTMSDKDGKLTTATPEQLAEADRIVSKVSKMPVFRSLQGKSDA